jgi:tetratricopeptide (TPR) repeat protein
VAVFDSQGICSMVSQTWQSRLTLLLVGVVTALTMTGLGWYATHSSASRFLPPSGPGEWIVYPVPIDPGTQYAGARKAEFHRSFSLGEVPQTGFLSICAFEQHTVTVNGSRLSGTEFQGHPWRETSIYDIAPQLRKGENTLKIEVTNKVGPPAVSLRLAIGNETICSDQQWEVSICGAAPRAAHPASLVVEPRAGNAVYEREKPIEALWSRLPLLVLFAGISAGFMAAVYFWQKLPSAGKAKATRNRTGNVSKRASAAAPYVAATRQSWLARMIWLWPIVLWLILFINNQKSLTFVLGFDSVGHIDYIKYIQEHWSLPLADEGWEMHQPPLYYIVAASLLRTFGLPVDDDRAVMLIRGLSLVLGIANILLVLACLRLIFPDEPRKHAAGLLVAAFLPVHLYMFQYVSNETMATVLGTAAIYLCLSIIRVDEASVTRYAILGLCLGAALLTKVTAILVAGLVLATLAGRLSLQRQRDPRIWLRTIVVVIAICAAVSGWHYWRVWNHFGIPLVGNYDAASGYEWWQHPGYSTLSYYFRFGRSLADPFFSSSFDGYLDGFYSTLWGDGMWGGYGNTLHRPPWNYEIMAAGYVLALLPTLAVVIGAIAAIVQLVRRPSAELFLLLGLPSVFGVAVIYQYLRFPYYGHAKAFYCLMASVSLCALGAWGFDLLVRRWKIAEYILGALMGTWALAAFASFWVQNEAAANQAWKGLRYLGLGRAPEAVKCYKSALDTDRHNLIALRAFGELLFNATESTGLKPEEARMGLAAAKEKLQQAVRDHPNDAYSQTLLALAAAESARIENKLPDQNWDREVLFPLRKAVSVGPDYWQASYYLGYYLEEKTLHADPALADRLKNEAIAAYRISLGIAPAEAQLHRGLAALLAEKGNLAEAIEHYKFNLGIHHKNPNDADRGAMVALAWILATTEESRFRDADQAVHLAERACELTEYRDAGYLSTLAAAYAEAGRFQQAMAILEQALKLAAASRHAALVTQIEKQLKLCRADKPYREIPQKVPADIR